LAAGTLEADSACQPSAARAAPALRPRPCPSARGGTENPPPPRRGRSRRGCSPPDSTRRGSRTRNRPYRYPTTPAIDHAPTETGTLQIRKLRPFATVGTVSLPDGRSAPGAEAGDRLHRFTLSLLAGILVLTAITYLSALIEKSVARKSWGLGGSRHALPATTCSFGAWGGFAAGFRFGDGVRARVFPRASVDVRSPRSNPLRLASGDVP
jgi:hypothetical protein